MRALFIWEAPPPLPQPEPLSGREVLLLVDVDLGTFAGVDPECCLGRNIAAALAHRDAIRAWEPPPFVSQPDVPIDGHRDGLSWGYVDVPSGASEWRVLMTSDPVTLRVALLSDEPPQPIMANVARFLRHRFHGFDGAVFVRDGVDVERVGKMLARAA